MADKKTQGGWATPEPEYDPTTAPAPEPSAAESTHGPHETVEQNKDGSVKEKPKGVTKTK